MPDFEKERNRPSLWTYYETLPVWCRENPILISTLYAFEYHKPHLTMRQKELGLNLMASMLRPVEGRFRRCIEEIASSSRKRVTVENGKAMMNELNFYVIDVAVLGSDSDNEMEVARERTYDPFMSGGIDDENVERNVSDLMNEKLAKIDIAAERQKVLDENSIEKYQLDPGVQDCLTDFPVKEYAQIDEVENAKNLSNEHQVPINFYDNDDGFWDEFIRAKQQAQYDAGFITLRPWFKH